MKILKYLTILVILLANAKTAFSATTEATTKSLVPPKDNYLKLGSGYNSNSDTISGFKCLLGNEIFAGNTSQRIIITNNMSTEMAREVLEGQLSVEIKNPVMKIGAGATLSNKMSSNEITQAANITIYFKPKDKTLDIINKNYGTYDISSTCSDMINYGNTETTVGNEYINAIHYTAYVSLTMAIQSNNKSDRDLLSGYLKFKETGVEFSGSLEDLKSKLSSSTKISINMTQKGGDPTRLLEMGADASGDAINCNASSVDAINTCVSILNKAITYAKKSFPTQLNTVNDYAVMNYESTPFLSSGINELERQKQLSLSRESALFDASSLYEDFEKDKNTSQRLMNAGIGDYYTLKNIYDIATLNARAIKDTVKYCLKNNTGEACKKRFDYDSALLYNYDRTPIESK